MYSTYVGIDFLQAYVKSREAYLEAWKCRENFEEDHGRKGFDTTRSELIELYERLQEDGGQEDLKKVDAFTKSFEVRKRIYSEYTDDWKPTENARYCNYDSYLLLADCLLLAYKKSGCLKYYSCLLKLDDTLLSVRDLLDACQKCHLSSVLGKELRIFKELADAMGILLEG